VRDPALPRKPVLVVSHERSGTHFAAAARPEARLTGVRYDDLEGFAGAAGDGAVQEVRWTISRCGMPQHWCPMSRAISPSPSVSSSPPAWPVMGLGQRA
jgi:hypothetical protein